MVAPVVSIRHVSWAGRTSPVLSFFSLLFLSLSLSVFLHFFVSYSDLHLSSIYTHSASMVLFQPGGWRKSISDLVRSNVLFGVFGVGVQRAAANGKPD